MVNKKYSIPISWESFMRIEVEAENLQEATKLALDKFLKIPDDNYLDDSFRIDEIIHEENPDETFDIDKTINDVFN